MTVGALDGPAESAGHGAPRHRRPSRWPGLATGIVLVLVLIAAVAAAITHHPRPHRPHPQPTPSVSADTPSLSPHTAVPLTTTLLDTLPTATTDTTIAAAPQDPDRQTDTTGVVVHNPTSRPIFTAPAGVPFAQLPSRQADSDTWLPVIAEQPGWVQVLLPSRPNGSTGWLESTGLLLARTPYTIDVSVSGRTLDLTRDGHRVGHWRIAVGKPATPTPTGRTFLLASIRDPSQTFSPLLLALGTHSTVLASYHGGPATTAIHTWTDPSVYGHAASNGCLRVPPAALKVLTAIPLGTLVRIHP